MPDRTEVTASSAEFVREFGFWQQRIVDTRVVVTHHGRRKAVFLSSDDYDALMRGSAQDVSGPGCALSLLDRVMALVDRGCLLIDEANRVALINPEACALLELAQPAVVAQLFADVLPGLADLTEFEVALRTARGGGRTRLYVQSPAHPERTLRVTVSPVLGYVVCILKDVTKRRDQARALSNGIGFERALLQMGGMAFARLNSRGRIKSASDGLAMMIKIDVDRLIGIRMADVILPPYRVEFRQHIERVLEENLPFAFSSFVMINDTTSSSVELSVAPIEMKGMARECVVLIKESKVM